MKKTIMVLAVVLVAGVAHAQEVVMRFTLANITMGADGKLTASLLPVVDDSGSVVAPADAPQPTDAAEFGSAAKMASDGVLMSATRAVGRHFILRGKVYAGAAAAAAAFQVGDNNDWWRSGDGGGNGSGNTSTALKDESVNVDVSGAGAVVNVIVNGNENAQD